MRRILMTCGALFAAGALAACSGSDGGKSSSGDYGVLPAESAPSAKPVEGDAAGRPGGGATGGGTTTRPGSGSVPLSLGESRIRTADLTVNVSGARNVAAKADAAADIALRAGGQIDGDERSSGEDATATLRLRVPPAALSESLQALSKLGVAKSRHLTSRDVTSQVADVKSRTASAQQAIARLRSLYDSATRVSDVIAIEQELSSRESDLESLQAQQRALSTQTELASITVYLRTADKAPPPAKEERSGFLGGLADGWDAFTSAAAKVATGFGAALPFLVLLVLLGAGLRFTWPRLRPARPGPAPAPTPAE